MFQKQSVKPRTKYSKVGDVYECKICGLRSKYQSDICRHVHVHEDPDGNDLSIFTYNGHNIYKSTEDILIWKATHNIPLNALDDNRLKKFFPECTIFSDKTSQSIIDEVCEQIITLNLKKTSEKVVSLIMDGGTVIHYKWIAYGFMHHDGFQYKFEILDVIVFENRCTAENIRKETEKICKKIHDEYAGYVVGVCTDNASNFVKTFLEDDNDEDFVPLGIIRTSCGCHTVQLAIKDLCKKDKYLNKVKEILKEIPQKIALLKKSQIDELKIGSYPPIQKQRWNSIYISLSYIIRNLDGISTLIEPDDLTYLNFFELVDLQAELKPIYEFTCQIEGDGVNQSRLYIAYRALKNKLEIQDTKRSDILLKLVKKRFRNTADITLAKLCYYTTNQGIKEKRDKIPHVTEEESIDDPEKEDLFTKENTFIGKFGAIIEKVCSIINMDSELIKVAIEHLWKHYVPSDSDINKFPSFNDIRKTFFGVVGNDHMYLMLARFIKILQVLPASEASAERIFAKMRDLHNNKQTAMTSQTLRSNLILSFYGEQDDKNQAIKEIESILDQ